MNISANFLLGKLLVAGMVGMSASAMAQPPMPNETQVFGYSVPNAKIQVVSAETMLAEASLSFDGSSSVNAQGEATSGGKITATTSAGPYTVVFSARGRVGDSISTTVEVNGVYRPAVVRIAAVDHCAKAPCAGSVRLHVEAENWTDLEIYLPGSKSAI